VPDSPNSNAELLRGILIALGLLALSLGAFLVVASHGRTRAGEVFERVISLVAPTAASPPAAKKPRQPISGGTAAPLVSPSAGAGPAQAAETASAAGGPSGAGPGAAPSPASAAQALRQVLHDFRGDPRHTASITISTGGKIATGASGPLTHDGLPMDAVDGATLITGSVPARAGP
jgi:hypothetical protein